MAPRGAGAQVYDYPFINPFEATVLGTPPVYRAELPERVFKQELALEIFPERRIPELFWYHDRLRASVARQRVKAPLIFTIAGTGASHNADNMLVMEKAFYQAGFHVVSLPSPSHPNFIVTASETRVPGLHAEDARDLYRVMRAALAEVAETIEVSEVYLTGYSLGAAHAAFVAKLDEDLGALGIDKVLLINPPVSLYSSLSILDRMIELIPGGLDNFNAYFESLFEQFAAIYREEDFLDFTDEFLYAFYKKHPPGQENLEVAIGMAFRFALANVIFVSDVLTRSGVVVRRSVSVNSLDSVTNYFRASIRAGFLGYIDHLLLPFVQRRRPGAGLEDVIEASSLRAIEGYLRGNPKFGLMTNEDDIILDPEEFGYLETLFAGRATIFPTGGHLGNLAHRDNVAAMVGFFTEGWGRR